MTEAPYRGPERRIISRHEVADMVAEELDVRLAAFETNLMNHINVKFGQFELSTTSKLTQAVNEAIDKHIDDAFPPGPLHKHKEQHQKHIDAAEAGKKIKMDIQIWAIRGIIIFFLALVGIGAKEWLLRELGK